MNKEKIKQKTLDKETMKAETMKAETMKAETMKTEIRKKAENIVNKMTLDEKLSRLTTSFSELERLGIKGFYCGGEAAHGVQERNDQSFDNSIRPEYTTTFQNPIGMSSSFDRELVKQAGNIVGMEARALLNERGRGKISAWAPTVDLLRDPRWGRNEEGYGEDPYVIGQMASSYINGMAGDDDYTLLGSCLKHFYANNNEEGRLSTSSDLPLEDKWEMYLEAFRQVIKYSKAQGVMASYNAVDGVPSAVNEEIKDILKDCFNLQHALTDGGGMQPVKDYHKYTKTHAETVALGLKAGIDMFTDDPAVVEEAARMAFENGMINEELIDKALVNKLIPYLESGVYDKSYFGDDMLKAYSFNRDNICTKESMQVTRKFQSAGCVLLKNDGILPINISENNDISNSANTSEEKKVALVGPLIDEYALDWYSGIPQKHITMKEGLSNIKNDFLSNELLPVIKLKITDSEKESYIGMDDNGLVILVSKDEAASFKACLWDDERITLKEVDSNLYLSTLNPKKKALNTEEKEVLNIGRERPFGWFVKEVFHFGDADGKAISFAENQDELFCLDKKICKLLNWKKEELFNIEVEVCNDIEAEIIELSNYDYVCMLYGTHPMINCKEEIDRKDLNLSPFFKSIIRKVSYINKDVVLVLLSNHPVAVDDEIKRVKAILWSATGSQELGNGIWDILTGKESPSGRLTQTWYKKDVKFFDILDYGIKKNKRTYMNKPKDVLFDFGFGLSYSDFEISDIEVSKSEGMSPVYISGFSDDNKYIRVFNKEKCSYFYDMENQGELKVTFSIKNIGNIKSDRVVLVFAKLSDDRRKLVGFKKIKELKPGECRKESIIVDLDDVRIYDPNKKQMIIDNHLQKIEVI